MSHTITIGQIYIEKIEDSELEEPIHEIRVKEYTIPEHKVDKYLDEDRFNTSSCYINIWGFPVFWFNVIGNDLSEKLGLHSNTGIITPEALEKFGLDKMFSKPFVSNDLFVSPIKPLITDIKNLPDDLSYLADEPYSLSEDNIEFFTYVMRWFKYWAVKSVELYGDDAYIEFC